VIMQKKIIHFDLETISRFNSIEERNAFILQFHLELSYLDRCADKDHRQYWENIDKALYRGSYITPGQRRILHEKNKLLEQIRIIIEKLFRHEHTTDKDLHTAVELYEKLKEHYPDFIAQHPLPGTERP